MPTFDELDALIAEAGEFIDSEIGYTFKSDWDASNVRPLISALVTALSALRDTNPEPAGEYMEGIEEGYKIGIAEAEDLARTHVALHHRPVPSSPEGSK